MFEKREEPLVSIITVCFNSEKTIIDTLESVLYQLYENIEYIVIDGKSKDKTVDIIKRYENKFKEKKIKYKWISEKDNGIYDAMNKGIEMSSGEIIGILNSDDWYEKNTIEKVIKEYRAKKFDMLYGNLRIIKDEKKYIKKAKLERIVSTRYWNHPTTFINKKVYKKIKYKNDIFYGDLDFMLRIRRDKGYKVVILNEVLSNFRVGGISTKKSFFQTLRAIKDRNQIYRENGYSKFYYIDNFIIEMLKYIVFYN